MQSGYNVFHFTKWSEWEWSSGSFGVELLSLKHERKNLFHSFSRCVQLLTQSLNNFHPIMKILPLSLETPRSQIIITIFRPTSDIICFSHFFFFFFLPNFTWTLNESEEMMTLTQFLVNLSWMEVVLPIIIVFYYIQYFKTYWCVYAAVFIAASYLTLFRSAEKHMKNSSWLRCEQRLFFLFVIPMNLCTLHII